MKNANEFDYVSITEIAGDEVTPKQVDRLCNRYYWAGQFCAGKDVVEASCETGQGLGYLAGIVKSLEAGDFSEEILFIARRHYKERIALQQFDAQNMPFADKSKDVIILFEAIYYLLDAEKFVSECVRVLRPEGKVLIATANKDLYDFNPSPHTYKYYGVVELNRLFEKYGFKTEFLGEMPVGEVSMRQRVLRPVKKLAVMLGVMPKTTAGKKWLKGREEQKVFVFIGTFGVSYELELILEAAKRFEKSGRTDVCFILAGTGEKSNIIRKKAVGLHNVVLPGWIGEKEIGAILSMSYAGLVPCKSVENTIPNKPFEYLSAGLPLINSLEGEMAKLVDQHGFGLNYLPGNLDELCACIGRLADDANLHDEMSRNASEFFKKYGDADKIYDEYVGHIEMIAEDYRNSNRRK